MYPIRVIRAVVPGEGGVSVMTDHKPEETRLTPEMSRRRLRLALKEARESIGLTQRDVAKALSWSLSKVIRIEAGAVGVSVTDARAITDILGVPLSRRQEIEELARLSRGQSWTSAFGKHFTPQSLAFFALEGTAKSFLKSEPNFIPGLLQTTEYSRELLRGIGLTDEERIEAIVNVRAERQDVFSRREHSRFHFVIGEAAFMRPVGGDGVMRRQLQRVSELSESEDVTIQFLPLSAGIYPKVGESYTLLEFGDEKMNDVLYLENAGRETVSREDPAEIAEYLIAFQRTSELAHSKDALRERLEEIVAERFPEVMD